MPHEFEYAYLKSVLGGLIKPRIKVTPYVPKMRRRPSRNVDMISAWKGIEEIIPDLIERFQLGTDSCLEFGVEHGFSTVALSSYFSSVTGVAPFKATGILRSSKTSTSRRWPLWRLMAISSWSEAITRVSSSLPIKTRCMT